MVFSAHSLKMDVEVDPALFVKCRLCLDEMGMYQIVPAVQQQMQFCYGIEVNPYDGLSQLICRKCKNILTDYYTIKTDYIEKQNILRTKTNKKVNTANESEPQQEIEMVSSSQQMDVEEDSNGITEKRTHRQSSILHSDPSKKNVSGVINKKTATNNLQSIKKQNANKFVWKNNFDKKFACRICRKHFSKRRYVIKHSRTHIKHYKKYEHVLANICTVALNKTDNSDSPPTQLIDTVKYSHNKILQEQCILEYNIVYVRKSNDNISQTLVYDQSDNDNKVNDSSRESSLVHFQGNAITRKRGRKNRILSNSSDDFSNDAHSTKSRSSQRNHSSLEQIANSSTKEVECINIDDTSTESTSCKDNDVTMTSTTDKENVENTIHHICMMCNNKYINRINTSNVEEKQEISDLHLQNKILSLGRKIIYNQGFRSNGLIRFLEKKNLKVIWIPQKSINVDYVRIATKFKSKEIDEGWKKVDRAQFSNYESSQLLAHLFEDNIYDTKKKAALSSSVVTKQPSNLDSDLLEKSLPEPSVSVNDVIKNIDSDCNLKNKLLNANPVANPKQLPKKANAISWLDNTENIPKESNLLQHNEENDSEICMPVITSTTSLAPINKEKPDTNNEQINLKNTARIKVKPVTELLSKFALNSLHQHQQETHVIWNQNENHMLEHNNTQGLTETAPTSNASFTPLEHSIFPSIIVRDKENMILDTIELPNTRTESPFNYFGNLLNMHGINLLPTNTTLHNGFICVIKYKAEFKQETTQEPKGVALSLSLFGFESNFCIQIRDKYQTPIDISKISAHWEWEILKTYTGDVSKKILKNSQKIKENLFKHARTFVSLLESIKVVQVV